MGIPIGYYRTSSGLLLSVPRGSQVEYIRIRIVAGLQAPHFLLTRSLLVIPRLRGCERFARGGAQSPPVVAYYVLENNELGSVPWHVVRLLLLCRRGRRNLSTPYSRCGGVLDL